MQTPLHVCWQTGNNVSVTRLMGLIPQSSGGADGRGPVKLFTLGVVHLRRSMQSHAYPPQSSKRLLALLPGSAPTISNLPRGRGKLPSPWRGMLLPAGDVALPPGERGG